VNYVDFKIHGATIKKKSKLVLGMVMIVRQTIPNITCRTDERD